MSVQEQEESSRKRKRPEKSRQGPSSKRRRADEEEQVGKAHTTTPKDGVRAQEDDTKNHSVQARNTLVSRSTDGKEQHSSVVPQVESGLYKGWTISRPRGGAFLDKHPQFTADGNFLAASKSHELQILSLENSSVHKTIQAKGDSVIRAFAVSSTNSEQIHLALSNPDRVEVWDWDLDRPALVRQDAAHGTIVDIAIVNDPVKKEEHTVVLEHAEDLWSITINGRELHKTRSPLTAITVSDGIAAAIGPHCLVLGGLGVDSALGTTFVDFPLSSTITTLAVRRHKTSSQKKQKHGHSVIVSIALGTSDGEILVYDAVHVSERLTTAALPAPRSLHWHRNAVNAVQWSRDGNYLISGGRETVLVIWQLATGKKQFLPHLSADIEKITVSPAGDSYALQLADNSVMVLSTSELKPTAHFPDLQSQFSSDHLSAKRSRQRPKDGLTESLGLGMTSAGCLNPARPEEILLAIPPNASANPEDELQSRPLLLSFNLKDHRHNYRQALTRNHITDLNTGPQGKPIQDPDVSLLQVSHDGKHLVTIETWRPPPLDYQFLALDQEISREHASLRQQSYLKVWDWVDTKKHWALQERFEDPHTIVDTTIPGLTLALVSDPTTTRFFTIGQDFVVRSWAPRTKSSDTIWSCRSSVRLPNLDFAVYREGDAGKPARGSLAISADGSLIAASISAADRHSTHIQLLATNPLSVLQTLPPIPGRLDSMTLHGRCLIAVTSNALTVIDIPRLSTIFSKPLSSHKRDDPSSRRIRHLSVANRGSSPSEISSLVAISIPSKGPAASRTGDETDVTASSGGQSWTKIEVWDYLAGKLRFRTHVPGAVTGLFYPVDSSAAEEAEGGHEWVVLTGDARVYRISAPRRSLADRIGDAVVQPDSAAAGTTTTGSTDVVGQATAVSDGDLTDDDGIEVDAGSSSAVVGMPRIEGNGEEEMDFVSERPVVRPEQLAALFSGPDGAVLNMPVRTMFDGIMDLFSRKPLSPAAVAR